MRRIASSALAACAALVWIAAAPVPAGRAAGGRQAQLPADAFNDAHFHLTNYVQEGIDVRRFLEIMGRRVGRWMSRCPRPSGTARVPCPAWAGLRHACRRRRRGCP